MVYDLRFRLSDGMRENTGNTNMKNADKKVLAETNILFGS